VLWVRSYSTVDGIAHTTQANGGRQNMVNVYSYYGQFDCLVARLAMVRGSAPGWVYASRQLTPGEPTRGTNPYGGIFEFHFRTRNVTSAILSKTSIPQWLFL